MYQSCPLRSMTPFPTIVSPQVEAMVPLKVPVLTPVSVKVTVSLRIATVTVSTAAGSTFSSLSVMVVRIKCSVSFAGVGTAI